MPDIYYGGAGGSSTWTTIGTTRQTAQRPTPIPPVPIIEFLQSKKKTPLVHGDYFMCPNYPLWNVIFFNGEIGFVKVTGIKDVDYSFKFPNPDRLIHNGQEQYLGNYIGNCLKSSWDDV